MYLYELSAENIKLMQVLVWYCHSGLVIIYQRLISLVLYWLHLPRPSWNMQKRANDAQQCGASALLDVIRCHLTQVTPMAMQYTVF